MIETARSFARALDRDAYDDARAFLADGCVYEIRGKALHGRDAILASYEEASRKARKTFDAVRYESSVEPDEGGDARILYTDVIEHAGRTHRHRCAQRVTFDAAGRIIRIVHDDLRGEREALAAFMTGVVIGSHTGKRTIERWLAAHPDVTTKLGAVGARVVLFDWGEGIGVAETLLATLGEAVKMPLYVAKANVSDALAAAPPVPSRGRFVGWFALGEGGAVFVSPDGDINASPAAVVENILAK